MIDHLVEAVTKVFNFWIPPHKEFISVVSVPTDPDPKTEKPAVKPPKSGGGEFPEVLRLHKFWKDKAGNVYFSQAVKPTKKSLKITRTWLVDIQFIHRLSQFHLSWKCLYKIQFVGLVLTPSDSLFFLRTKSTVAVCSVSDLDPFTM